jgi:hypothetical protein
MKKGTKHTEDWKRNMSKKMKGRNITWKDKLSKSLQGYHPINEWKVGDLKGSKNWNWKGGISRHWSRKLIFKICCNNCGTTEHQLDIHHKDGNVSNNEINNLVILCRSCHKKLHIGLLQLKEVTN